jgi:hypothetical protein
MGESPEVNFTATLDELKSSSVQICLWENIKERPVLSTVAASKGEEPDLSPIKFRANTLETEDISAVPKMELVGAAWKQTSIKEE